MDLRDYARILRTRWRLILISALVGLAVAAAATAATQRVYEARSQLFVSTTEGSTVAGAYTSNLLTRQRVVTYQEFATSPNVARRVDERLGLTGAASSAGKISTTVPEETPLLTLLVQDTEPQRAADIANAAIAELVTLIQQIEQPTEGTVSPLQATVVRDAVAPGGPVRPRPAFNLTLGLVVGLIVGAGLALLRETLDTRIKSVETVGEITKVPNLGVLFFDPAASDRPLLAQDGRGSPRAEAFRSLRTNLRFVDVDAPPRSIVMTSAVASEGKSTTTANLGITIAQTGAPVILVDADLRRPRLAEYLGLEGAVGLTDVLIGRVALDDALQRWGTDGMLVLPSGPTPPNPSELLGSQQMAALLRELEERGLVLLDAPPLLPVTDAAVLATVSSGALLVVRAGSTRREQLSRSIEGLERVGAHLLGTAFNMVPAKGAGSYDYYGYGYGPQSDVPQKPKRTKRTSRRKVSIKRSSTVPPSLHAKDAPTATRLTG